MSVARIRVADPGFIIEGVAEPSSNGRDMPSACLQCSQYQSFDILTILISR